MTKEDRLLLVKDLSARLPYGVEIEHIKSGMRGVLHELNVYPMYDDNDNVFDCVCHTDFFGDGDSFDISEFKPYLFPMSSMTEEQHEELFTCVHNAEMNEIVSSGDYLKAAYIGENTKRDWLLKNHFDCMGLIPKDLALNATCKNIYGL